MAGRLRAAMIEMRRVRALAAYERETEALYRRALAELHPGPIPEIMPSPRAVVTTPRNPKDFPRWKKEKPAAGCAPRAGENCSLPN